MYLIYHCLLSFINQGGEISIIAKWVKPWSATLSLCWRASSVQRCFASLFQNFKKIFGTNQLHSFHKQSRRIFNTHDVVFYLEERFVNYRNLKTISTLVGTIFVLLILYSSNLLLSKNNMNA